MPHVVVKMFPGRTEEQKKKLAEEIVKDIMTVLNSKEETISVAIEDVEKEDWPEKVYRPEIYEKMDTLYKKPGYNPLK